MDSSGWSADSNPRVRSGLARPARFLVPLSFAGSCVAEGEPPSEGVEGRRNAPFKKPLVIGVTGGMASGKSTVARMFAGRSVLHIDADALVHQLMNGDRETINEIAQAFPDSVIARERSDRGARSQRERRVEKSLHHTRANPPSLQKTKDGSPRFARDDDHESIDRAALAAHIANHPEALATLEHILHPRVRAMEEGAILHASRNRIQAVVLDVPLLFETGLEAICDAVVVVHAPLSLRRRRAFKRKGMTEEKWNRLLDRQLPSHIRNRLGDHVIFTAIGKAATRRQVMLLMKEWGLR